MLGGSMIFGADALRTNLKWWQKAVFYQIYPRSFADGNGDGIGDFPGMIQKLDYLQDLGVDALWLSPHFPSPQFDCGYDISDYTAVAPEYGTLSDFKRFLHEAHRRGLRVVLDLVLNHTSDQHPWFIESRSSRDNPRRDWYVWHDGKQDKSGNQIPPNNWASTFGGDAWEYDQATQQYFYHFFLKQQPDLNWRNPAVRQAMWDAVRFWLDLGVDGFRLDAIATIYEHPDLLNHPLKQTLAQLRQMVRESSTYEEQRRAKDLIEVMHRYQLRQPGLHELMQELRTVVNEYGDTVLIGEEDTLKYYGDGDNELHLVFNFPLMRTDWLTPAWIRANQQKRLAGLAAISPLAWPCNTLGNHDSPRVYNQFGDGIHNEQHAQLSLALMLTLRGTPFLYYGEEIGMTDLLLGDISQFRDLWGLWQYNAEIQEFGTPAGQALRVAAEFTRDKCRTPMQWQNATNAGFCPADIQSWLPVNPNFAAGVNVQEQVDRRDSLFNFYRSLLRLRKNTPALIGGTYTSIHESAQEYLAFIRATDSQKCLVVLNYSDRTQDFRLDFTNQSIQPIFSNHARRTVEPHQDQIRLAPFEILVSTIS